MIEEAQAAAEQAAQELSQELEEQANGTESADSEEQEAGQQEEPEEDKVPKGVQKRLDQMTYRMRQAERENQKLKADYDAMMQAMNQKQATPTLPNGAPDPAQYPAGHFDPAYVEALTDYKVQMFAAQQAQQQAMAQKSQHMSVLAEQARAEHEDFDIAVREFLEHPLLNDPGFASIIEDSENPAKLAYYFGTNPDELDKFGGMNPMQAARHLGRIEAMLNTPSTGQQAIKPASAAPKPPTPLTGARSSAVKTDLNSAANQREYEEMRERQIAERKKTR